MRYLNERRIFLILHRIDDICKNFTTILILRKWILYLKYNFQSTSADDQKLQPAKYNSVNCFWDLMKTLFCRGRCNGRLEMNSEKRKKICRENVIILSLLNSLRKIFSSISRRNLADKKEEQKINYNNTLVDTMYSNKRPFLVY